jgi:sugar phosphate permease
LVAVLWVTYLLNYTDRQIVFSIYPALRQELHFTDAQLGLIGTTFLWVYAMGMGISGRIGDVLPRHRIVIASLILWSLCTLGTSLSGSVAVFLFWRALMGFTEALYLPAAAGLIATAHPGATRSRALSLHGTAQLTGIVAGGWYGGWAADHIGWRNGFLAIAALGVGYALVLMRTFRGLPQRSAPALARTSHAADVLEARCFRAHATAFFAYCIVQWMLYAWLPVFIYDRYHLSMTESGFTATVFLQVSSVVGVLTGGAAADWLVSRVPYGRFCVTSAGLIAAMPLAYFTLAVHSLFLLKVCAAGFGFFSGLFMSNNMASIFDVVAKQNYGFATGVLNLIGGIAGASGTFMVGLWRQSFGMETLMAWAALATTLAAFALGLVAASQFQRDREQFCLETSVMRATS